MIVDIMKRRPAIAAAFLIAVAALAGCGGTGGKAPVESEPQPAEIAPEDSTPPEGSEPKPAEPEADAEPAKPVIGISGRVTFAGERPKRRPLELEADPACVDMHADEPLLSDSKVVSESGGVYWTFVYVKNPPEDDYEVPEEPVLLDQVNCRYTPHVMGLRAGQVLRIRNSDGTTHNVRSFSNRGFDGKAINKNFNFGQPKPGIRPKIFTNPENAIKVKCDIHPWMQSYVFAMDHPYFAATGEEGNFTVPTKGLPAGEYTLVAWHEVWGEKEQQVTVGEDGLGTADFTYEQSDGV